MTLVLPIERARPHSAWRRQLMALGLVWGALLVLFARDAAHIVSTWWTSTTFGHCFVVAAIVVALVWGRRHLLARLEPIGWAPGLAIVALGAVAWLLGAAAEVVVVREFALLAMAEGAVAALLGPVVLRGLAFPLGYAAFLVPFGEWLEGPLQAVTVRLSMPLLALLGIPASSNGIVIHAGRYWFEVAEACSGAKFVIAMLATGVLVAHLCFRRWGRRLAFLAACVVVPVLANAVRAAMTMALADWTSVEAAAGFDHIVYGWVWFGVVMAATLAIGWRWFDRAADAAPFDSDAIAGPVRHRLPAGAAALAAVAIAGGVAAWASVAMDRPATASAPLTLADVPGWRRVPIDLRTIWRPNYPGADHQLLGRYADAAGDTVDLAVAIYDGQGPGRAIVGYGIGAVGEGPWLRIADLPAIAGAPALRIAAPGPIERVVTTRYRIGGEAATGPVAVKWQTLRARLFGGSQRAEAIHLSAVVSDRHDPAVAITRFARAMRDDPAVAASLPVALQR